jgi:hypothetical protein
MFAMDGHLNEPALARRWGLSPRTLQRWRLAGVGPAYLKLGGRIAYRACDIEAFERDNLRLPHAAAAAPEKP